MKKLNENFENKNSFTIEILRRDFELKEKEKIKNLSNNIKIKGFRKGIIPENIVSERYKKEIYNDLIIEFSSYHIQKIIKDKNFFLINNPIIKSIIDDKKNNIKVTLEVNFFPIFNFDFKYLKINKHVININQENVDNEVDYIHSINGLWKKTEKVDIENNDKIFVKIISENADKKIKDYTFKEISLFLNDDDFIIKNIKNLISNKDTKFFLKNNNLNINMEEKSIICKIEVKKIERKFFEDTEENLKSIFKTNNIKTRNNTIKRDLEKKAKYISYILYKENILKNLVESYDFNILKYNQNLGKNLNKYDNEFKNTIINNTKLKIIFNKLKSIFNINIQKEEINERLKIIHKKIDDKKLYKKTKNIIFINELIKKIEKKITINIKQIRLNEILINRNLK